MSAVLAKRHQSCAIFGYVVVQMRGLQAQLADARQEQKEQAADTAAVQARLEAANVKSAAQDVETGKLQVRGDHVIIGHAARVETLQTAG